MFNRKSMVITGILFLASFQLTACGNKSVGNNMEADKVDKKNDNNNDSKNTDNITDDIEYLYHDALDGKVLNKDEKESVQKEYEVIVGEFSSGIAEIGEIVYEDLTYEAIQANEADNVQFLVNEGDKVRKGDILVSYHAVVNEVELAEQTRDVERMEKEYSAGYDSRKAEITMAEHELKKLTDKTDIAIKELEIKKLKNSLEKYIETKETVVKARAELNERIAGDKTCQVEASTDGYVISINEKDDDINYYKNDNVVTLSKKEKYHIEVKPHEDVTGLKYGSEVKIVVEGGKNGKDVSMGGKVIAAPNILNPDYTYEPAQIEIIDEPDGVDWSKPIKVKYDGIHIDNALLVPVDAVMMEKSDGGSSIEEAEYVYISKGDVIYKSYLNVIDKNNDYYRVCGGVSEGDTLVLFK